MSYFPFKGIVLERPYPTTGLSTKLWMETVPVRGVPLGNLYLTQNGILIEALFRTSGSYSGDEYPHVVLWAGSYYLEDGHHRVVAAALSRQQSVYARVFISA